MDQIGEIPAGLPNGEPNAVATGAGTAALRFVLCDHAPENASVIAAELADCDVIALEGTGLADDEERGEHEQLYSALLSSRLPQGAAEPFLAQLGGTEGGVFVAALLRELGGSDKPVILIDVMRDHPEYPVLNAEEQAKARYHQGVVVNAPNSELRDHVLDGLRYEAQAIGVRDGEMAGRLLVARTVYPGKRIGPVVGAAHTGAAQATARTVPTERVYVVGQRRGRQANERVHYSNRTAALRQLRFRPGSELPDALVDRLLLQELYFSYTIYGSEAAEGYLGRAEVSDRIENELVGQMTDAEVSAVLAEIDAAKAGRMARLRPERTRQSVHGVLLRHKEQVEARA
jgi:hypothetical protein